MNLNYFLFSAIFYLGKAIKKLKLKLLDRGLFNLYAKYYCLRYKVQFEPSKVTFNGHAKLHFCPSSKVIIGDEFVCNSGVDWSMDNTSCSKISVWENAILKFGFRSGISNTTIHCSQSIIIGDYVNIGAGCLIFDTNYHSSRWKDREDRIKDIKNGKRAPIMIGNHVFVGAQSVIMKGVTIGDKSMIAAGSVVMSDIPSGEIWGGNPARFIAKIKE